MSVDSGDLGLPVPERFWWKCHAIGLIMYPIPRNETPGFHIFRRGIGPDEKLGRSCTSSLFDFLGPAKRRGAAPF
jgi:hypothetical protein